MQLHLSSLPDDALLEIITHVELKDAISFSRVRSSSNSSSSTTHLLSNTSDLSHIPNIITRTRLLDPFIGGDTIPKTPALSLVPGLQAVGPCEHSTFGPARNEAREELVTI